MSLLSPLPSIDDAKVTAAIAAAEARTSGEIRVFLSSIACADPIAAATVQFERLGMTRTRARNGVLLFVAPRSRNFAVIGDEAVHQKCGPTFWTELAGAVGAHFARGAFTEGLVLGIERAGALLAQHFPGGPDDHNELPDAVERG